MHAKWLSPLLEDSRAFARFLFIDFIFFIKGVGNSNKRDFESSQ